MEGEVPVSIGIRCKVNDSSLFSMFIHSTNYTPKLLIYVLCFERK